MMEPAKLDELLREIAEAINGHGAQFEVDYETHLYIARRVQTRNSRPSRPLAHLIEPPPLAAPDPPESGPWPPLSPCCDQ